VDVGIIIMNEPTDDWKRETIVFVTNVKQYETI